MSHANIALFVPHAGCTHRCTFCDQRGISGAAGVPTPADVRAACLAAKKSLGDRARDAEVAFFGGSFTAIDPRVMLPLLEEAAACVGQMGFYGIRCSTRPDAVDDAMLLLLKGYGVTAIELGAQSLNDGVLQKNRRGHTAGDVTDASLRIRSHGFSLGLQMMTGLYGDTPEAALATARGIRDLAPDTVRIYPAVVMKHTELAELYRRGAYTPQTLEEAVELCAQLLRMFEEADIRVIRVGLHGTGELQQNIVAGPFHPAFRELCEARMLLERVLCALKTYAIPPGDIIARIPPGAHSKLVGQHKKNVEFLKGMHYNLSVCSDPALDRGDLFLGGGNAPEQAVFRA